MVNIKREVLVPSFHVVISSVVDPERAGALPPIFLPVSLVRDSSI